jgi:uncharacterized protein
MIPAAMAPAETDSLNVDGLAEAGAELPVDLAIGALPRLADRLASGSGRVTGRLRFHRAGRYPAAAGSLSATLSLRCERCLAPLSWPLAVEVALAFVPDDRAEDWPKGYDPSVAPSGHTSLAALVEDELLLALPIVARHDDPDCVGTAARPEPAAASHPTQRPFANLRDWMKQ